MHCAGHAAYAARGFPLPHAYVTFRTHRTVSHGVALRGVALRSAGPQHFRAKSLIPNGPFRAPNFTSLFRAYRAAPSGVTRRGVAWRGATLRRASSFTFKRRFRAPKLGASNSGKRILAKLGKRARNSTLRGHGHGRTDALREVRPPLPPFRRSYGYGRTSRGRGAARGP